MLHTLAVNWANFGTVLLILAFLFTCLLLMLAVLIQKPQGGGLAGAFGSGAGSGQTAFGAKTGDALTVATIIIFVAWLGVAVGLNFAMKRGDVTPMPMATAPADKGSPADKPAPESKPATPENRPAAPPGSAPPAGTSTPPPAPTTGSPTPPAPDKPTGG